MSLLPKQEANSAADPYNAHADCGHEVVRAQYPCVATVYGSHSPDRPGLGQRCEGKTWDFLFRKADRQPSILNWPTNLVGATVALASRHHPHGQSDYSRFSIASLALFFDPTAI